MSGGKCPGGKCPRPESCTSLDDPDSVENFSLDSFADSFSNYIV